MAKILIAEDDRDAGLLMQLVLKRGGHDARVVDNGKAALDHCTAEMPDVILLDVTMPEMDGYEVARALKASPASTDVPIVFVTGSSETHQKVTGLTLGANDYITKPFHRDELLARVEVALRIKRQADELKAANERLATLSATDGLTGLHNRRHLDARLDEEVARAARHQEPLSCLMVDVDRFKGINDRFGHQEGDRVLQMVSGVLRHSTRISDIVGRYGGEEFTVVAPFTDLQSALIIAERIRATVAAQEIVLGGEGVRVTVSVGVAELASDADPTRLIAEADRALYLAKQAGRNRVAISRG